MTPLTDEVFLSRVQTHVGQQDLDGADQATIAVLRTLFDSMSTTDASALSRALPSGLRARLGAAAGAARGGGQHAVGPRD
ncbi:DUF2267 domain-containing protein [Pseudonocardia nantongensis]|uniref:DUF2267 domain-containing protein n=1 Tax=Pseudonocardia nantongensis TaxID=1181885 RepID=UPI00397CF546